MRLPSRTAITSVLALLAALAGGCAGDPVGSRPDAVAPRPDSVGHSGAMVVTANPHATRAGVAVLQGGGSAVDAAVAIEAVLSLVEPQSSGLGGGAFLVHYAGADREISVYDGRETAPLGAGPDLFLDDDGNPYGFLEAKTSGLSIGVPGATAMLAMAQADHGALPWSSLFDGAIELAEQGFEVSPRLRGFLDRYGDRLIPRRIEDGPLDAYHYFYREDGTLRDHLSNPAYADTLRLLRQDPAALYRGEVAQAIVTAARATPRPGSLSLEDLGAYEARRRKPLCVDYRRWRACGPPPPSSWIAVGMTLGLLEAVEFPGQDRLADWATFAEAQRLAYADRDHFVADDEFVEVPMTGLLSEDYLRRRAALIGSRAADSVSHGDPWDFQRRAVVQGYGDDTTVDHAGTTHFVVVDFEGNVVSLTASVESIFGSTRMAGGMFLNNQLTDFARQPRDDRGRLVANHPAPGKRPRSSMSPTIVLDPGGDFYMATGSPGGNSIIAYTLKTLIGVLDWGLTAQEAIELPNLVARGDTVRIEQERASPDLIAYLRDVGFTVNESAGENSGLSVVVRRASGELEGGVDPRREGTVAALPGD